MMLRIRGMADLVSGLIFLAVAAGAWLALAGTPAGSAMQMGPAFFPRLLCGFVGLMGAVLMVRGFARAGEAVGTPPWRPLAFIIGGVLLFALLIDRLGLAATTVVLVLLIRWAAPPVRIGETALLALGLSVAVVLIFSKALGLAIPVWPWTL